MSETICRRQYTGYERQDDVISYNQYSRSPPLNLDARWLDMLMRQLKYGDQIISNYWPFSLVRFGRTVS